jgi:hypothetical protein
MLLGASGIAIVSLVVGAFFAFSGNTRAAQPAATSIHGSAISLSYVGETSFGTATLTSNSQTYTRSSEVAPDVPGEDTHNVSNPTQVSASAAASKLAQSTQTTINSAPAGTTGFAGLNHYDSRNASHGNQFSLEPPDQGLCAGNGFIVEAVNDVMAAYNVTSTSNTVAGGDVALNDFFGLAPSIVRSNAGGSTVGTFGPFISDPKCYYDAGLNRWFLTSLELDVDPVSGAFTGGSHEYIAVSETSSPVGKWYIYSLDTTNGSGSSNCPCFGDQPLIGADANGFYISTNEFPVFNAGFNGAQIYGFSKAALAAGGPVTGVHINAGAYPMPSPETKADKLYGIWYSIQPATTPPGGAYESANNGTEYFMSALDFGSFTNLAGDNRVAVWALTNTAALSSNPSAVSLANTIVTSQEYIAGFNTPYGFAATQKSGSTPLGDFLAASNPFCGGSCGAEQLEQINANDDRMNQVVFANGNLWSGVNTAVYDKASNTYPVGIAYFVVHPSDASGTLSATMAKDGYITAGRDNVLFPSIGVNPQGKGVVAFTLSGPDYYPSAAYTTISASSGTGAINVIGAGVGPEDGFTGYTPFGAVVSRWGDYSASVAAPDGTIWSADEYINQTCSDAQFTADSTCGQTRTLLANWATFIYNVAP